MSSCKVLPSVDNSCQSSWRKASRAFSTDCARDLDTPKDASRVDRAPGEVEELMVKYPRHSWRECPEHIGRKFWELFARLSRVTRALTRAKKGAFAESCLKCNSPRMKGDALFPPLCVPIVFYATDDFGWSLPYYYPNRDRSFKIFILRLACD